MIKPGAVEAVSLLKVDAPGRVESGAVAKFEITVLNTGNVPTTVAPSLMISKDAETVARIPGVVVDLALGEEEIVKLYWDAGEEGTYTAVVTATCGETRTTSEPQTIEVVKGSFAILTLPFAVVLIVLIAIFAAGVGVVRRRRR